MALGDLVQMLEGLHGRGGCVGCLGEADPVPEPAPKSEWPAWAPWALGAAGLVAVWAIFLREKGTNLRGFGAGRPFMDRFNADQMWPRFTPYEGVYRTGTRSEWAPLPPARRNYSPFMPRDQQRLAAEAAQAKRKTRRSKKR